MSDTQLLKAEKETSEPEEKVIVLEKKRSIPGPGTTGPGQLAKEARAARQTTSQHPDAGYASRLARGITGVLISAWSFIFSALREAYWLLDPDAKCRTVGLQTVGRVDKTESEKHTDPETGRTSYTYYVRYTYQVYGRSHTPRKKVGSLGKLNKGDALRVYYLADSQGRNLSL